MELDKIAARRKDATEGPNAGGLAGPKPGPETAAVDMWVGLPRAEWEDSAEKWDCDQGRVPGPEEEFSEPRTSEMAWKSNDNATHGK